MPTSHSVSTVARQHALSTITISQVGWVHKKMKQQNQSEAILWKKKWNLLIEINSGIGC